MDGYIVYQGPAKEVTKHFDKLGYSCPRYANPADYFLKEFYVPYKKTQHDVEKIEGIVAGYEQYLKDDIERENQMIKHPEISSKILRTFTRVSF